MLGFVYYVDNESIFRGILLYVLNRWHSFLWEAFCSIIFFS